MGIVPLAVALELGALLDDWLGRQIEFMCRVGIAFEQESDFIVAFGTLSEGILLHNILITII